MGSERQYPAMVRFRTAVARFSDGWNVVVQFGDEKPQVYDPTFATEAEAEAKAREVSAMFKAKMRIER